MGQVGGPPKETDGKENRNHFQWEAESWKRQEVGKHRYQARNSGQMEKKNVKVTLGDKQIRQKGEKRVKPIDLLGKEIFIKKIVSGISVYSVKI